ncbi:unnamed protein product, partial [Discosporangium mesarthrocarpum]
LGLGLGLGWVGEPCWSVEMRTSILQLFLELDWSRGRANADGHGQSMLDVRERVLTWSKTKMARGFGGQIFHKCVVYHCASSHTVVGFASALCPPSCGGRSPNPAVSKQWFRAWP